MVGVIRYLNILGGQPAGQTVSLGASDAVMAFIAAFYLTFPRHQVRMAALAAVAAGGCWVLGGERVQRQGGGTCSTMTGTDAAVWQVHVFKKVHLLKRMVGWTTTKTSPAVAGSFFSTQMSFSALWALPLYFLSDFVVTLFPTPSANSRSVSTPLFREKKQRGGNIN